MIVRGTRSGGHEDMSHQLSFTVWNRKIRNDELYKRPRAEQGKSELKGVEPDLIAESGPRFGPVPG